MDFVEVIILHSCCVKVDWRTFLMDSGAFSKNLGVHIFVWLFVRSEAVKLVNSAVPGFSYIYTIGKFFLKLAALF